MPTPITYPVLLQNASYCTITDVKNLIGNVYPIANGDVSNAQIQSAIVSASRYIETRTQRKFCAYRKVERVDGNGHTRMVLPQSPLININSISIYFTYPLAMSRIVNDWELNLDREPGIVSFPTFIDSPFFQPFAFQFFRSSRNIEIDAWYGFTDSIYGDLMKSTDLKTYAFTYPTVVKQSVMVNSVGNTVPPKFFPIIYKNGVPIINTTYALVSGTNVTPSSQWQVANDNLVFTFNSAGNGYSSITFNTPLSSTDVISADYAYQYIPDDIVEVTAKKAAITLLGGFATASFADQQFQGASEIQMDGSRIRYQNGGQWGEAISDWKSDIEQTIVTRKKILMPVGVGFSDGL